LVIIHYAVLVAAAGCNLERCTAIKCAQGSACARSFNIGTQQVSNNKRNNKWINKRKKETTSIV